MKHNKTAKNIIVKCGNDFLLPVSLMLGFYIIFHGHLTPGGGFQGGVIVSAAIALIYMAYGNEGIRKVFRVPEWLKEIENVGSLMYTFFGLLGVLMGFNFCRNAIYNQGNPGDLYSSGTIWWMNVSVGLKVMMGVSFMLIIMLAALKSQKDEQIKR
jgi:multicomponent Na+:H+ antiporter subunit B